MPTFEFSKLVRDKIVEQQIVEGSHPHYRVLVLKDHKKELIRKIAEEVHEIESASANEIASELADVQQALDDLCALYAISKTDVASAQRKKLQKKGAFRKGIYVESITIDEANEWVEYYRAHPDRYREV